MGFLIKIFGKRSNIIPSVAQIILVIIILPGVCFLLSLLVGKDGAFSVLKDFFSNICIMGKWFELLLLPQQSMEMNSTLETYNELIIYTGETIIQTCIMAMCLSLGIEIGKIIGIKGIPLIQSLIGVVLGCIVINSFGLKNDISSLIVIFVLTILNLIAAFIGSSAIRKLFIGFGLDIIIAALYSGYICLNMLILNGKITDIKIVLISLFVIMVPLVICICLESKK